MAGCVQFAIEHSRFVKPITVVDIAPGLLMVIVSFDVAPDTIGLGRNPIEIVGGCAVTVRLTLFDGSLAGASLLKTALAVAHRCKLNRS
jgi:hypothetical protein